MVPGTAINFYTLSCADRGLGQDALNHARKLRVSETTEIKMGFLGCSPPGKLPSTMWTTARLVPTGMQLRGPDMSPVDMRLEAVSKDAAVSNC